MAEYEAKKADGLSDAEMLVALKASVGVEATLPEADAARKAVADAHAVAKVSA